MNLISLILSALIFGITLLPCKDAVSGHQCHQTENSGNESDDERDICPPLCSCDCCGSTIELPSSSLVEKSIIKQEHKLLFHYSFNYEYDYSKGVWHPPTIC